MRRIVLLALMAFPIAVLIGLLCIPECGTRPASEKPVAIPILPAVESPAPRPPIRRAPAARARPSRADNLSPWSVKASAASSKQRDGGLPRHLLYS